MLLDSSLLPATNRSAQLVLPSSSGRKRASYWLLERTTANYRETARQLAAAAAQAAATHQHPPHREQL